MREDVPAALDGERIDRVVALVTGCSRAEAAGLVAAGAVTVTTRGRARTVTTRSERVTEGDVVEVVLPDPVDTALVADASVQLVVVHEDDAVVVVDKPEGLVVHPGSGNAGRTLVHGLLARYPDLAEVGDPTRPGIVHRLDKGTSGLLVVARTEDAREALVADLAARTVTREYLALVEGVPSTPSGMVDAPIGRSTRTPTRMAVATGGKEARTRYELEQAWPSIGPRGTSLLRCKLETGRTHQIRVHLGAIGHPVVGDVTYGSGRTEPAVPRMFLHAARLAFDHPTTREHLTFDSPLPPDLAAALAALGPGGP